MANAYFDADYYLTTYPDLTDNGVTPAMALLHYLQYGAGEGRSPAAGIDGLHFDATFYALSNTDVSTALGITDPSFLASEAVAGLFSHYNEYGASEGRQANLWFDAHYYLNTNSDLAASGVTVQTALMHFMMYGVAEGRKPIAWFDASYYASTYTDVAAAVGVTDPSALTVPQFLSLFQHFFNHGVQELRSPQAGLQFDLAAVQGYVSSNPDIKEAFGIVHAALMTAAQVQAVVRQFYEFGWKEGRPAAPAVIHPTSGSTFVLSGKAGEVITGTGGDDIIVGVSSALVSQRTLTPTDQIDGAAGRDTLKIRLDNDFGGFTKGQGFLKHVEVVELTNSGSVARTFNAQDVVGVEQYVLNGLVSLTGLADAKAVVHVEGQASGDISLGYAAGALAGANDTLHLSVKNVGEAKPNGEGTNVNLRVTPNNQLEHIVIAASGNNGLHLQGPTTLSTTGASSIKITGTEGLLNLRGVQGDNIAELDASGYAGTLYATLRSVRGDAVLTGGTGGKDTLDLGVRADVTAAAYTISGFETLRLGQLTPNAGSTSFGLNASKVSGVSALIMASTQAATLHNFSSTGDLAIALEANGSLAADHTAATTVTVKAGTTYAASGTVNLSKAALVTLNATGKVGNSETTFLGTLNAAEASVVTASGTFSFDNLGAPPSGARLLAAKAKEIVLADVQGSLVVEAAQAENLSIAASGNFSLRGTQHAQVVTASVGAGHKLTVHDALSGAHQVTLTGGGQVELNQVATASNGYGVTVVANGLSGLKTGDILAGSGYSASVQATGLTGNVELARLRAVDGGDATVVVETSGSLKVDRVDGRKIVVDAGKVLGDVTVGMGTSSDGSMASRGAVQEITGSATGSNTFYLFGGTEGGERVLNATLTGGLMDDRVYVNGHGNITLKGDLGLGSDWVMVTTDTTKASHIDISALAGVERSGLMGGDLADVIIGGAGDDSIVGGRGADVMTGGAGNNHFSLSYDIVLPSDTQFDTITDWHAGSNTISAGLVPLSVGTQGTGATPGVGVATIGSGGVATFNSADTSLAQHLTAVAAALTLNGGASSISGASVVWQEGADAYLFISDALAGITVSDLLVKLTGVSVQQGLTITNVSGLDSITGIA